MTPEESVRRIIGENGAASIRDELLEYRQCVERMEALREELTERYPNMWVAMFNGDTVGVGDTLQEVLAEIDRKGIPRANAVVKYLCAEPRRMVL